VAEGTRVKVLIGHGQKGPEVTEITEVLSGTVTVRSSAERSRPAPSQVTGQVLESIATVKLYKADKGFGLVGQDGGGKDVFVHATALARAGLSELVRGQRVRMPSLNYYTLPPPHLGDDLCRLPSRRGRARSP